MTTHRWNRFLRHSNMNLSTGTVTRLATTLLAASLNLFTITTTADCTPRSATVPLGNGLLHNIRYCNKAQCDLYEIGASPGTSLNVIPDPSYLVSGDIDVLWGNNIYPFGNNGDYGPNLDTTGHMTLHGQTTMKNAFAAPE